MLKLAEVIKFTIYLIVSSLVEGGRVEQNDSGRLVRGRVLSVETGRLRVAERRRNAGSSDI